MKKLIDIEKWDRKEHFLFYNQFEDPYFGLNINIDCTKAYKKSKDNNYSFFLYYLYQALKSVNLVKEFTYRIEGENVFQYDKINAAPTINRSNGTFGFSYLEYISDFDEFLKLSKYEIEKVKSENTLIPDIAGENVIHFSAIPWVSFTSLSHPIYSSKVKNSIPKISFGKFFESENKLLMPVSIHANHALMDGYHVSQFINIFQKFMNK